MNASMHDIIKDYRDSRVDGQSVAESLRFVADVRGRMGTALQGAGWALIHAGNRVERGDLLTLDDELDAGYRIGYRAGRREASGYCAGPDLVWGVEDAARFRQLVREATGLGCLHQPGERCFLLDSGLAYLTRVVAERVEVSS